MKRFSGESEMWPQSAELEVDEKEAIIRQEKARELYRLFDSETELIPWRIDVNPKRGQKVFAVSRYDVTPAVRLQRSEYRWLPSALDPFVAPEKRNVTKFSVIKETFEDDSVDLSIEILRTGRQQHLITMQRDAKSQDVSLIIFNESGEKLPPDEKTDGLIDSLLHWTKDARA